MRYAQIDTPVLLKALHKMSLSLHSVSVPSRNDSPIFYCIEARANAVMNVRVP